MKFRLISADPVHVGAADGPYLQSGQLHDPGGELVEETDDAYLVQSGDDVRAWPKSVWEHVGRLTVQPSKSASKAEWVAYAKARGTEDADSLTKDDLIARYDTDSGSDTE